jgi:hypothetical protein
MEAGSEGRMKPVQSVHITIPEAQHCRLKIVFHSTFIGKTGKVWKLFPAIRHFFAAGS